MVNSESRSPSRRRGHALTSSADGCTKNARPFIGMDVDEHIERLRYQLQRIFDEMATLVAEGAPDIERRGLAETFDSLTIQINALKKRKDHDANRS